MTFYIYSKASIECWSVIQYLLFFQHQDDRTERLNAEESGPQGHNKVVHAHTDFVSWQNDQVTLPSIVSGILVIYMATVLSNQYQVLAIRYTV